MQTSEKQTARQYGILDRCLTLERNLLQIPGVIPDDDADGIPFDFSDILDGIPQITLSPLIRGRSAGDVAEDIFSTVEKHGLYPTDNGVDYSDRHLICTFGCSNSWRPE